VQSNKLSLHVAAFIGHCLAFNGESKLLVFDAIASFQPLHVAHVMQTVDVAYVDAFVLFSVQL
jgi:hypothetical protein